MNCNLTPSEVLVKQKKILENLFFQLVEKGTKLVLEQVVTTLASVADTAEEKFEQYYNRWAITEHGNAFTLCYWEQYHEREDQVVGCLWSPLH